MMTDDNREEEAHVDVLQEAQDFLNNMDNVAGDETLDATLDAIDGFAIDSDDEAEVVDPPTKEEKAVEAPAKEEASGKEDDASISNGRRTSSLAFHPLQDELLPPAPSAQNSTRSNSTGSTPAQEPQQPQPNIQEKAMSFASQISSFAQRAANQIDKMSDKMVSGATSTLPQELPPPSPSDSNQAIVSVELDNEQKAKLIEAHLGKLLPGERIIMFLANLLHVSDSTGKIYDLPNSGMWCCAMTYYRVTLFHTSDTKMLLQMPLASIDKVEKSIYATPGAKPTTLMGLVIYGKDNGRQLRFTTPSYAETLRAHEALQTYSFPGRRNLGYLFAFESKRTDVMASIVEENGQKKITLPATRPRFQPLAEFTRQGFLDNEGFQPWTLWTKVNHQYQLCQSYPSVLIGPAVLQEASAESMRIVRQCAAFRSEQRLPVLTWACSNGGGSLWRASQPKVGLQGNRSAADEMYFQNIAESAATANALSKKKFSRSDIARLTGSQDAQWMTPDAPLKILDLRPKSSAMANRTGGYGYENTSYYTTCSIQFCNIGNIHAVRDAYQKLSAVCLNANTSDTSFGQLVEETKWMTQIRLILSASWQAAFWIHVHGLPVMLHCSHGWDRTSQVAALCQILLDPYYRTMEGFVTLVEKDFMSFGHPFHTRCAHGEGRGETLRGGTSATNDEGQISPIFIQFLDCAYQMVHQYPEKFEFNTRFLLLISEHVYSCRFGSMLCDTEREREVVAGIRQRTHSLWDYLQEERKKELTSVVYDASSDVLWMPHSSLLRNVTLWADRHAMHGPKETLRATSFVQNSQWENDQQSNLFTSEDYHQVELCKAREEAKEWKRVAEERLVELEAIRNKQEEN